MIIDINGEPVNLNRIENISSDGADKSKIHFAGNNTLTINLSKIRVLKLILNAQKLPGNSYITKS